jgi:hypothetical protein
MASKWLIAGFLAAHAAIHASFIAPRPPATAGGPTWPFELGRSWLLGPLGLDGDATRMVGLALVAVTMAGFALAAIVAAGVAPGGLWPAAVAIGGVGSIALLGLYFSPWFVVGVAIDVVLLWAVLVANWGPEGVTQ